MKKKGFGSVDHKPAISSEDLKQLYEPNNTVFNTETPCGLQNKVWFDLMFYLCRRGRENLRNMTKSTFSTDIDACGREFVFQAIDEADKNHRSSAPDETVGEARMYSQPGNVQCPVTSFKKYLNKLHPEIDALWQRPLNSFDENSSVWYCKSPLGKNILSNMMPEISKLGKLSRIYTNHSIRATVITALDNAGVEARHIMCASGHKNEASIRSYACRLNDTKKREMSECLGGILGSQSRSNSDANTVSTATGIVGTSLKENEFPEITPEELDSIFSDSTFDELSHSVVSSENVPNAQPLSVLNLNAIPTSLSTSTGFHVYPTMNNCVVNFNFGPQK
ncbi:uncharacterized protein LOC125668156 [Ostrea edulis]|uniref:uncharacterized protein LOC125668156 n=1 Tax=Ostrea edulis TaxID=37623 RepID=UPI0024AF39B5|nr:uncharacterized protein LOC125668156 [Ostrea edulis]